MSLLSSLCSPSNAENSNLLNRLDRGACFQRKPLKFVMSAEKYHKLLKNYESNGPQKLMHKLIESFEQFDNFCFTSSKQFTISISPSSAITWVLHKGLTLEYDVIIDAALQVFAHS